jgi:hypothetical protein
MLGVGCMPDTIIGNKPPYGNASSDTDLVDTDAQFDTDCDSGAPTE